LPDLVSTDWLVLLLYLMVSVGIGVSMRSTVKIGKDFFQAGRSLPTWVCAVAFISASLGAPEVMGMGAAGASFGFRAALYFVLGTIPALLLAALFVIPVYYRSGAATLPGYLGLRFDAKTRVLSAVLFIVMALASSGLALFMVARILQALRIFDKLFFAYGWPREGIFPVCILLAAVPVLIYTTIAGLRGTIISQVVQFSLLVAGFLPVVWIGLNNVGGWSGLNSSFAAHAQQVFAGTSPAGIAAIALMLGLVLGALRWTTDFRVLQMALAAKNVEAARKIPVIAAAARLAIPFLLVLPGAIAVSIETPQSKTVVRNENGAIYHDITIVPPALSEGRGIVPALIDPATNKAQRDNSGQAMLDYGMATPNMATRFAVTGLLGLVIAGLLASLMSSVAAGVSAVSSVFACDLYQSLVRRDPTDAVMLRVGRWSTAGAAIISVGIAFVAAALSAASHQTAIDTWIAAAVTVFALLQAPQLATLLQGVFAKRITANGAFAGMVAGFATALLHHGLTLPAGTQVGLQGGWFAVVHQYHGPLAQACFTVVFSVAANLVVSWTVTLMSREPKGSDLAGLSFSPQSNKPAKSRSKRLELAAIIVILITLVLALVFA
jgi:SSS family solute:Na+ symporter